ncbi:MAG: hypothetical protein M1816_001479 [Peltula sp. TS41687]|nr:MAG: hypothetical protein M1816_001479 [Peltula sp. TS41687]
MQRRSARQVHTDGPDETTRPVKRRKLGVKDDGFHGSTIVVITDTNVSTPATARRGRGTPRKVPGSSSENNIQRVDDDEQQSAELGLTNGQPRPRKDEDTMLISERGGSTNGEVMQTPSSRRRGRPRRVSSPQAVRLSDLIRGPGDDVSVEEEVTTSTPSTRQSGRERRKPRRFEEMVPIARPNLMNGSSARRGKDDSLSQIAGLKDIQHEEEVEQIEQPEHAEEVNGTGDVGETSKEVNGEKIPLMRNRGRVKKDNATGVASTGRYEQSDPVEEVNSIVQTLKDVNAPKTPQKRKRRGPKRDDATEPLHEVVQEHSSPVQEVIRTTKVVESLRDVNPRQSLAKPRKGGVSGKGPTRLEEHVEVTRSTIDPTEDEVISLRQGNSAFKDLFPPFRNKPETEQALFSIKTILLEKLTGKRRLPLVGVEEEFKKVYQTVSQTVLAGEGNSLLVIGARGSGKSTLVETVIDDLSVDHATDFHTVRLNGFIHTDDKLALRETWRQLGREMEVEEDGVGTTTNHADILSSLLALLSHPSEFSAETRSEETAKAVIFILDEFDLFASHPRQTLLYNLFDIAQARKAPVAVLGLTTKIDVVESLEKRVTSRFSHRYVHTSLAKSLEAFWEICQQGLLITEEEAIELESAESPVSDLLITAWNQSIQDLPTHSPTLKHLLQQTYALSKSAQEIFTSLLHPLIALTASDLPLGLAPSAPALQQPSSNLHLLPSLTDLQLSLLISAARLEHILNTDTCTFHMVYDEYVRLASSARASSSAIAANPLATAGGASSRVRGKELAKAAWEGLADCGLVVLTAGAGPAALAGGASAAMWKVDVALEEIPRAVQQSLSATLAKWCREI